MSDLISRKAAINALNKHVTYSDDGEQEINTDCVFHTLESLPSAEPERRGRWEFIGDQMFRCSECGHTFTQKFLEGWRESLNEPLFPPHCPNCGSYNGGGK